MLSVTDSMSGEGIVCTANPNTQTRANFEVSDKVHVSGDKTD